MWFPSHYTEGRKVFLDASEKLGFEHQSFLHPSLGPKGEPLYVDVALGGNLSSSVALVHLVGTHGVEAFTGSAIQCRIFQYLKEQSISSEVGNDMPKLIFVHPVNPYGMAWLRRVNHNNVDLNRNFRTDESSVPDNSVYSVLSSVLNPETRMEAALGFANLIPILITHKPKVIVQAIGQGQYSYPKGLFYGGDSIEPELVFLQSLLRRELSTQKEVWAIDVHTGLGKWGNDILFVDNKDDIGGYEALKKVYKTGLVDEQGPDSAYQIYGKVSGCLQSTIGGRLHYVLQEFGTYPMVKVLYRTRLENYFHHYSQSSDWMDAPIKKKFFECFFPRSSKWRERVINKGLERFIAAFDYLKSLSP